ncbi:MAG: DUF998 domain-containing protein [Acidobacteria bacterium]|jgi:hypothetical membrane protein|nr:DUF998 domain-containing protein [Acidobacteriota bacterium]
MKTKHMMGIGSVIPVIFWGTLTVCGYVMGDYNHLTRLVSELGAMGTGTQYMFTAGLLTCAILSVLFVIGLCQECKMRKISMIPAWIILTFSISLAGAALFPLPLRQHLWAGMPSIALFLSPLAALILWRGEKAPANLRLWAIVSLAVMLLGFLAFMPEVLGAWPGLKQRFFHIGWSLWFIGLGRGFIGEGAGGD